VSALVASCPGQVAARLPFDSSQAVALLPKLRTRNLVTAQVHTAFAGSAAALPLKVYTLIGRCQSLSHKGARFPALLPACCPASLSHARPLVAPPNEIEILAAARGSATKPRTAWQTAGAALVVERKSPRRNGRPV